MAKSKTTRSSRRASWKPRLACADFSFPLLEHEAVLDLIAQLDVEAVDIGLFESRSHLQPSQVLADLRGRARDLAKRLDERGLTLADIFPQADAAFDKVAINHPQAGVRRKMRDWFKRMLEFTVRAGGSHMTVLPGVVWEASEAYGDSLNRCAEELAWRVAVGRDVGVTVSTEAHLGSIVPSPRQAKSLLDKTPGLTLTLDYGHFVYQGFKNDEVHSLIPHASHFHARAGAKRQLQPVMKENEIDFPAILRRMRRSGYSGYLGIEYVWIDWEGCNRVDNLSETIQLREILRSVKV
jgi:sugar phosphate isomerase/epimerase